jgi:hypothetical protein
MNVAGESENFDIEQEHLNNVFGARLRITSLRAPAGPGIELLEYLAPRNGRPAPLDLSASDISHWQTTLVTTTLQPVASLSRLRLFSLVSPTAVSRRRSTTGASMLICDPDAHAVELVTMPWQPRNRGLQQESKQ